MTANDDRDLIRVLAQACGWTCTLNVVGDWLIANRKQTPHRFGAYRDEAKAWEDIYKAMGRPLHSVDAALALPWPEATETDMWTLHTHQVLGQSNGASVTHYRVFKDSHVQTISSYANEAPTLARALCECFAQWWRAKEAGK